MIRNVSTRSLPDSLLPRPSPRACARVNLIPDNRGSFGELNRSGVHGAVPHSLQSEAGIGVGVGVEPVNELAVAHGSLLLFGW